jgi:hypothetical protein
VKEKQRMERQRGKLLLGWVMRERDSLGNIALQSLYSGLEEYLLGLVDVCEWVQGLLNSASLAGY